MNDQANRPRKPLPIRDLSRNAYNAILRYEWPSHAAQIDFGIASSDHLGALQYEFRTERVTLEQFDDALGWGPALNKLIGDDNPYRGVTFETGWDSIMVPIREWATVSDELFPVGRLFATPEALKLATQDEIVDALRRHAKGDFGEGDAAKNHAEMGDGNEVLSRYRTADGSPFFVRTWFEPPMTLVLLESELKR
jgi:hypothetical protein